MKEAADQQESKKRKMIVKGLKEIKSRDEEDAERTE